MGVGELIEKLRKEGSEEIAEQFIQEAFSEGIKRIKRIGKSIVVKL